MAPRGRHRLRSFGTDRLRLISNVGRLFTLSLPRQACTTFDENGRPGSAVKPPAVEGVDQEAGKDPCAPRNFKVQPSDEDGDRGLDYAQRRLRRQKTRSQRQESA